MAANQLSFCVQRLHPAASAVARRGVALAAGVAFLAAASRQSVPLAGTPVPFTWQPQAVLLLSALLGPGLAEATVMAWLCAAALGAPVLAGLGGPVALVGPSAGYLWAYVPASWAIARFGRRANRRGTAAWLGASCFILAMGTAWLGAWVGPRAAWAAGFVPFAATDAAKATVALVLLARLGPARQA